MNALKTGIHAQSLVIRGEDPDALARLAAEYNAEFRPVSARARDLVDALVRSEWHTRRLERIQAEVWESAFDINAETYTRPNDSKHARCRRLPLGTAFFDVEDRFERLQRRLHAYERSSQRALKQLRELQIGFVPSNPPAVAGAGHARPEVTQPDLPTPPPAASTESASPLPPSPIGFVPSNSAAAAAVGHPLSESTPQPPPAVTQPDLPPPPAAAPLAPPIGFVPAAPEDVSAITNVA